MHASELKTPQTLYLFSACITVVFQVKPVAKPPKEQITFYGDRSVGIRRVESAAEQAIKWAQQRRLAIEVRQYFL
jgi:hypothetical protein